jgi:hypothetical protein
MLKNLLRAGAIALAMLIPSVANADGVNDFVENNWILETENFTGEVRTFINADYYHVDLEYRTPVKGLSVGYRFAEAGKLDEHRFDILYTYEITDWLYVKPSIEYRVFNSVGPESKFRFRPLIGLTAPTWNKLTAYAEFTPMWEFGSGVDGFDFTRTKTVVGVDYEISKNISIGPFFEYDTLGNWDTEVMYFGTNLKVTL